MPHSTEYVLIMQLRIYVIQINETLLMEENYENKIRPLHFTLTQEHQLRNILLFLLRTVKKGIQFDPLHGCHDFHISFELIYRKLSACTCNATSIKGEGYLALLYISTLLKWTSCSSVAHIYYLLFGQIYYEHLYPQIINSVVLLILISSLSQN